MSKRRSGRGTGERSFPERSAPGGGGYLRVHHAEGSGRAHGGHYPEAGEPGRCPKHGQALAAVILQKGVHGRAPGGRHGNPNHAVHAGRLAIRLRRELCDRRTEQSGEPPPGGPGILGRVCLRPSGTVYNVGMPECFARPCIPELPAYMSITHAGPYSNPQIRTAPVGVSQQHSEASGPPGWGWCLPPSGGQPRQRIRVHCRSRLPGDCPHSLSPGFSRGSFRRIATRDEHLTAACRAMIKAAA